jgi:chromosome segregation ATPase
MFVSVESLDEKEIEGTIAKLEIIKGNLKSDRSTLSREIDNLQVEIDKFQDGINRLDRENFLNEIELKEYKDRLQTFVDFEVEKSELRVLEEELKNKQNQLNKLMSESLNEKIESVETTNKSIEFFENHIKLFNTKIEVKKSKLESLESKLEVEKTIRRTKFSDSALKKRSSRRSSRK